MRILHILASIESEAAGPSVSVPRLAEAQARLGAEVEIATIGDPLAPHPKRTLVPHTIYPQNFRTFPILSSLRLSNEMQRLMIQAPQKFDVIHSHGLWLAPNIYPAMAVRKGVTWVAAPRGMLGAEALRFSAIKKRLFWLAVQNRALSQASLIHATSEQEATEIRKAGITVPSVVVPNGVDIPPPPTRQKRANTSRTILSLGRIHKKKGLDRLIAAWAPIERAHPEWLVRIVGPNEGGHAEELIKLIAELGCTRVHIEDPIFGQEKLEAYRESDVFVLSTQNENFAMTVAESLAAGTPVISTKGAPWAGLEENNCGLWIDHGPEPLTAALRQVLQMSDEERTNMGLRGRDWMARDFSWDGVASSLLCAYRQLGHFSTEAKHQEEH